MAATTKYLLSAISKGTQQWRYIPKITSFRFSSFQSSPAVGPLEQYPEVEVVHNAPEWQFVERLLPPRLVPNPAAKAEYPSGWMLPVAATLPADQLKYFVARTKNHMVPVYLHTRFRGQRRLTVVRRIQGDIWTLERDLRVVVEQARGGKLCASRVNEMSGQIHFHGDYVDVVREYLKQKGF